MFDAVGRADVIAVIVDKDSRVATMRLALHQWDYRRVGRVITIMVPITLTIEVGIGSDLVMIAISVSVGSNVAVVLIMVAVHVLALETGYWVGLLGGIIEVRSGRQADESGTHRQTHQGGFQSKS